MKTARPSTSFRRGVLTKKGKLKEIPPAQEVITRAVRLCLPNAADKDNEEIKNILIQCGGFNGPQAKLARACMRLCGQTHEADYVDREGDGEDDDMPDIIAGVGEQVKPVDGRKRRPYLIQGHPRKPLEDMLWEEYLGWHFHFIRCLHIRYNLMLPEKKKAKDEKLTLPPKDDKQQYEEYTDIAARIAEQEAEQAR